MSKFRYTITFDCDEEYFSSENCEELRREIGVVCDTYCVDNLKIRCEDEYCIKKNDNLTVKAEDHARHFNLFKIHVITQDDLNLFINDGSCSCLDDLNVSTVDFDWDFAQKALVNVDENKVIMWNDNIHSQIDKDINNFLDGITYVGDTYSLKEICMLEDEMKKYNGVKYR